MSKLLMLKQYVLKSFFRKGFFRMSRKIGDFTVWIDKSIDTNQIKVHESLIEQNNLQNVKITKGNKRMYLKGLRGSIQEREVQLNSSSRKKLHINETAKVEISTCSVIDYLIQKLTLRNLKYAFGLLAASLAFNNLRKNSALCIS